MEYTTPTSLIIFIYFTLFLLVLIIAWFGYVMLRIQRMGKHEDWDLPPVERKVKRDGERRRVVGVRRVFIGISRAVRRVGGVMGRAVGRGRGKWNRQGGGEEEIEMEERNRLERMHTQRRIHQTSLAARKKEILRELERLKAGLSSESSSSSTVNGNGHGHGNGEVEKEATEMELSFDISEIGIRDGGSKTYDVEAQPPRPHSQQRSKNASRIRQLQEELRQLERDPGAADVTSNIPTTNVNNTTNTQKPLPHLPHFLPNPQSHQHPHPQPHLPRTPSLESINLNSPPSGETVTDSDYEATLVNASE